MRRGEDLGDFLAHRGQLVDGEEATVVDLLARRAERGEAVRLRIQQPVEGIEAMRLRLRSLGSPLKTRTVSAMARAACGEAAMRSASRRLATTCSRRRSATAPGHAHLAVAAARRP